ncbi:putative lyase [Rosa chinensis]|uniref:Putative lyase n=1 Tax=Rosa chinensis TaxID=74649 RepID=A0A2P6SAB1_ROSCH|nr:(-)-germacrene D synthase [Rosa chinensis]PRQ55602.1 putative lyase [Rosa chinensis]
MSVPDLVSELAQTPTITATPEVTRRSANYSPSIWGDHFLSYASIEAADSKSKKHVQDLKEELKRMIMAPAKRPSQKLHFIDHIQRLGVSYHFEDEIDQILQQVHREEEYDDLCTTALSFRLLRQQGYNASCNMFNKFKEDDGRFKESLIDDVLGLLSLYEASHLQMPGEDILNEALTFTTAHLESAAHRLSSSSQLWKQVTHALYQPLWKGMPRIEARHHLSIYQEDDSHNETLLNFAKMDFNTVQKVHQKELSEITRWWKDLDFATKLPFARDKVVEAYFWALGVYFQPEYYFARMVLAKAIAIITVIDDIYDVRGTYEELESFTEAIERWDISAVDQLPDYMKVCYKALLNFFTELEESLTNKGILYRLHYAREGFKVQVRAYFQEAKWFKQKYTPSMEEYMSVERYTSFFMVATVSFVGMGVIVTKDSMDWVFSEPKISKAASIIGRLMNDLVGHKFEQKREHIASAVECYMKQYGVTEEEAEVELTKQVNDAWKDINEEWLDATSIPRPLLLQILNFARSSEILYKGEDVYTHSGNVLKGHVVSLFIDPVPI